MRQTFILDCVSALPASSFWEKLCSSASFSAMMACNDLSLFSRRDILTCVCVYKDAIIEFHYKLTENTP